MRVLPKQNNQVVYVVTNCHSVNQRLERILSLRKSFEKMILVTKTGTRIDDEDIVAGSYPNPLGLLRLMGLHKTKQFLERYLFFPSPNILYAWSARKKLKERISSDLRSGKRVCLLTSVPNHDISLVGLYLKTDFPEIYWIVDWRDLWSYDKYYFERTPEIYRNRLLELEKRILENCDINVTTNAKARTILERYYNVPPNRVVSINHPFYRPDLDEGYASGERQFDSKKDGHIKIGFLGNLFKPPKVPGHRVVEAIDKVIESGLNVELHIFGDGSEFARKVFRQSRNGGVVLHRRTGHRESLRKISECDFLLLTLSDSPNCHVIMHSKLPHYLLLRRSILAMVPEKSAVAEIIRETGSGYVIPAGCGWGDGLKKVLQEHLNGKNIPERNNEAIEAYSWENISKQWMEVFSGAWK